MTFTDDDLKRLKEHLSAHACGYCWECVHEQQVDIQSLLARLEAAEDAMLTVKQLRQTADWIVRHGDLTSPQLLVAEILRQKSDKVILWKRSAGK